MIAGFIVTILLSLIATGIGFMFWRREQAQVKWMPLPGMVSTVWFSEAAGIDPTKVLLALITAEACLAAHTPWTSLQLRDRVRPLIQIYIKASDEWRVLNGVLVEGEQANDTLYVGPQMRTMPHEYAHLAERVLNGSDNQDHVGWEQLGIFAACADYKIWRDDQARP